MYASTTGLSFLITHTHTHTNTHTHTHICAHTVSQVHTHTHAHTRTYTHTHAHTHTRTHTYACTHTHTPIHTQKHAHPHTCTQTYTYTNTHTHIQLCVQKKIHTCTLIYPHDSSSSEFLVCMCFRTGSVDTLLVEQDLPSIVAKKSEVVLDAKAAAVNFPTILFSKANITSRFTKTHQSALYYTLAHPFLLIYLQADACTCARTRNF